MRFLFLFLFIYEFLRFQIKKFDLIFNKKMFKFAINDFIKNINFVIDEIKIVEIIFNELFIFVIAMNKYNNIIFFN